MFRNNIALSAAALATCLIASQTVLAPVASASVVPVFTPSVHMSTGAKMVKVNIANSGSEALNLTVGTEAVTIAPGKTVEVKALLGSSITVTSDTGSHKAGEVLTQVTKELNGATVRVS